MTALDLKNGDMVPVSSARELIPGKPSHASVLRWIRDGKLDGARIAGRFYTSRAAVDRFLSKPLADEESA